MARGQAGGRAGVGGAATTRPAGTKTATAKRAPKTKGAAVARAARKVAAAKVGGSFGGFRPTKEGFLTLYSAPVMTRIEWAKAGVGARDAKVILGQLRVPQGEALAALRIPAATVNRKARTNAALSPAEAERVLGVGRLLGQVQALVQESGDPEGFDASAWLSSWMATPVPALGGFRPLDLMDTMTGQALVSRVLSQMQSSAYA